MEDYILGTPSRPGPEADLVQEFVGLTLPEPQNEQHRLVFIEPLIETTRPDIVLVDWDPSVASTWPSQRRFLKRVDLRIAQLLLAKGSLTEAQLKIHFPRRLNASLARLEKAAVTVHRSGQWTLRSLNDIFAVRRIVTFEAKISALSKALEQAHFNTWFSSESYILTPVRRPSAKVLEQARLRGVGFWSFSRDLQYKPLVTAKTYALPQSFASWLFNEWVWKTSTETKNVN